MRKIAKFLYENKKLKKFMDHLLVVWFIGTAVTGCAGWMGNFKVGDKEITVESSAQKELRECKTQLEVCQKGYKQMTDKEIQCLEDRARHNKSHSTGLGLGI